jgi:hypothetical protein
VLVDELLMMQKTRLSWKVYLPSECARYGIKSIELCDAKSGYVRNFIIYIGQYTVFIVSLKKRAMWLRTSSTTNGSYTECVIMDNWFSSPDLFCTRCNKETNAMGTSCQNRKGVAVEIKSAKLKKGKHVSVYIDRLMKMKCKKTFSL